jgi:hypothetical protein
MSSPEWRLMPLRNFWQDVNWENRKVAPVLSNDSNGKVTQTLSFSMSVRDYFRAISWTGIPAIAATAAPKISEPIDETKETLEDFLDDIYKFF